MPSIILTTLNARYIHASLGLRYLYANLGELQTHARIDEFVITTRPVDIAEKLLADNPSIIGLGAYIWNIDVITELAGILKTLSPETILIAGGPEISFETTEQKLFQHVDYVITGQADLAFKTLCRQILNQQAPVEKIIQPEAPKLDEINFPYQYFTDEDIRNRIIYVEASRGCPFKCEFCLSALDKTALPFNQQAFLNELEQLYQRGVRQFKFVDRTFNLKIKSSIQILEFFLDKIQSDPELFLHFELIPDHLPDALKEVIKRFPAGSLQFEIGIQSFDEQTQSLISRKQNNNKTIENINWLRAETTAHLHTDLIAGLPGEHISSFARGFNQLVALNPHEIQVGILKRLRGTPIIRHTVAFQMKYNPQAPYNILSNNMINFSDMQRINRFARYWDIIANSGRFQSTLPFLLGDDAFENFMRLSDWLFQNTQQTHQIALKKLFDYLYEYLTDICNVDETKAVSHLTNDFKASPLKGDAQFSRAVTVNDETLTATPKRQQRHIA